MIEFHDREREIDEIKRILSFRPDSIYFVYGLINSGKSSLMDEVVKRLPEDYVDSHCQRNWSVKSYRRTSLRMLSHTSLQSCENSTLRVKNLSS